MGQKLPEGVHRSRGYSIDHPGLVQVRKGFNARKRFRRIAELAEDIAENGLYDALWVRPDRANKEQPFILIDGERRIRALRKVFEKDPNAKISIPLRVFHVNEEQAEDMMTKSFLDKDDLTYAEKIGLVQRYQQRGLDSKEIGECFHRSPGWVDQMITLAGAAKAVLQAVDGNKITISAALMIARKKKEAAQPRAVQRVIEAAGGKKSKTTKAASGITGTAVRPGKKELRKVVAALSTKEVEEDTVDVYTARELVMLALSYATGESDRDALLTACAEQLKLRRPADDAEEVQETSGVEETEEPVETQAVETEAPEEQMVDDDDVMDEDPDDEQEVDAAVPSAMASLFDDE